MNKFSEFVNEALLDLYIRLHTDESCESLVSSIENPIEILSRKKYLLTIGK